MRELVALSVCGALIGAVPARAVEDVPAYLPGVTLGVPAGLLPAPGVYGSVFASHFFFNGHNDVGQQTPARIGATPAAATLLYVTDYHPFGAAFAVGITEPIRYQTLDTPAVHAEQLGFVNTVLNVGTLSWDLGHGFHISIGQDVYIKDGSYQIGAVSPRVTTAPVSVGRNYWTFQPKVAMTYKNDGWTFTSNLMFNVNTDNTATHYQSGSILIDELTLTKRFGGFDLGVVSAYIRQYQNDTQFGQIVPAISGVRGAGNKLEYASLGPMIAYNAPSFSAQVYFQQNVLNRNTGGGSQVWGRLTFPLYSSAPNGPTHLAAAGQK